MKNRILIALLFISTLTFGQEKNKILTLGTFHFHLVKSQFGVDFDINSKEKQKELNEIIKQIEVASNNKIQIIVFPELCVTGYTCQDLFEQDALLEEAEKALNRILDYTNNLDIICIIGMPIKAENQLFNTAVVIQNKVKRA